MRIALALSAVLAAASGLAQTTGERPLVETAPVVGWGDYVWLLPIVLAFIAVAAWYVIRRRHRL